MSALGDAKTIEALRDRQAELEREFAECFSVQEGFPKLVEERRDGEAPRFRGLWTFGDGPGVVLSDGAAFVEAELLCNRVLGEFAYTQYGCVLRAVDLRYHGDYGGYYRTSGKSLKHIRGRLELFGAMVVLRLFESVRDEGLFGDVPKVLKAFRLPIRFAEG
ncbi:hypothetical protein AKJ09_00796 [Labilithrix luteola]|uniref:Uncharacterized protein n=1 Tax=Labilithrix luteola TaxID=1391654 RepID=A0A0K1PKT2_9BACT|nr:hypothetical protein AKJ09_00796 [Labilithrix luteola]